DTTLFERLPEMEVNAFYADEQDRNIVWLGGSEGLFRYDKALTQIIPSYNVILRKVSFSSDSLVFGGTFLNRPDGVETKGVVSVLQPVNEVATFPYKLASGVLAFKFAAPSYDQEEKNRYQFKLDELNTLFGEGEEQWSNWTEKSEKEYTNLREGDYVFRVKAKNIYGIESEEMSYAFQILPPWYRSWWAYLAYVALASVVIWLIVRLNTVRLQRANDRLEKIVDERTAEVKKQNGQLQQQKEEILTQNEELQQQKEEIVAQRDYIEEQNKSLKEKNERIVDSIRYAQTIQEGILPFSERLNKYLKDYFILYRPKDIVSGDFYWFEEKEGTTFFAVADCTGHGVPGAFMSMIGTAILNDIVLKSNLLAPAEILEEMNRLIIRVLKQEYVASNQDGIDLGFVAWKTLDDQVHLSFSGAHRPLYYITDGKLEEVKGANKSIGGYQVEGRTFIDTEITLKAGDSIFMTTDGYADQNSEDRKKVGSLKLKEMIEANANKSIGEISELLNGYLNEHQGNAEQRDDITIVGIRF
ncbi:MAG: SpoIIE family protein phosphatase, partial [Flammeovirgaceae bacterium]